MLFHLIFFILIRETLARHNAGTAIFFNKLTKTDCWTNDEIVKLRARRSFERLLPPQIRLNNIDAKYINDLLHYFHRALYSMDNIAPPHTLALLKESLSDTIGAHLRSEILPAVRLAYYAGYVPYRNAKEIHDFYDDIQSYLNTQGLGWNKPKRTPQNNWSNLTVAKILIGVGTFFDPCAFLITKRDNNACIHLPIPKHDDTQEPSAIALPFKTGGLVSLSSPASKNVLLKYYTTASRCILSSSPEKCRHSDFVSFNNAMWHWMKRDVAPHLMDEKLYAAYGGVLRIAASVQNYGKGLSRRNLFEDQDNGLTKWHPWQALTDPYFYINADWTPQLYVGLVILTAISIYLLQMCYGYLCGYSDGCQCATQPKSIGESVTNARMSVIPHESAVYSTETKHHKQSTPMSKASLCSLKTQKVYDLNENTEKLMPVIMSSEGESEGSVSSHSSDDESGHVRRTKSESPPKLETSMSQLILNRKTESQSLMTSTRTVTGTYQLHTSESQWSSDSSTSSRSSSSSSKRRLHSSHDLEWTRRFISKHILRSTLSTYKHDSDYVTSNPNSQR